METKQIDHMASAYYQKVQANATSHEINKHFDQLKVSLKNVPPHN